MVTHDHQLLLRFQADSHGTRPVFFILFRETLETSIIVSVLLTFLKQSIGPDRDAVTYKKLVRQVCRFICHENHQTPQGADITPGMAWDDDWPVPLPCSGCRDNRRILRARKRQVGGH